MWVKLPSYLFRWDNSVRANQISMGNIYAPDDDDFTKLKKGIKLIGYCDAHKLSVLPSADGYAVMLEFPNGEEFWVHNLEIIKERTDEIK